MNILETVDKYFQPHSRSYFLFFFTDQLKNPMRHSGLLTKVYTHLNLALGAFGDNHIT